MFSLWYGSYTSQKKLLPGSCAELNNIVRVSVTTTVCFLPPKKNIRRNIHENYSEYTATRPYRQQQQVGIVAAPRPWVSLQNSGRAVPWKEGTFISCWVRINICLSETNPGPRDTHYCSANDGNRVRILLQISLPNLFWERFENSVVSWVDHGSFFCTHNQQEIFSESHSALILFFWQLGCYVGLEPHEAEDNTHCLRESLIISKLHRVFYRYFYNFNQLSFLGLATSFTSSHLVCYFCIK